MTDRYAARYDVVVVASQLCKDLMALQIVVGKCTWLCCEGEIFHWFTMILSKSTVQYFGMLEQGIKRIVWPL